MYKALTHLHHSKRLAVKVAPAAERQPHSRPLLMQQAGPGDDDDDHLVVAGTRPLDEAGTPSVIMKEPGDGPP
jgi:hypothetical protein